MTLDAGRKLGPYEIVEPIGKGGMGEVYRARDTKLDRDVAIKVLPEEFAQDKERLARFEREAKLLASLNHVSIGAIYGFEEFEDSRFLVLELIEGDTLADRLQRGPVPVEHAIELAVQIADALDAAHRSGVIHRDLKPANIKLTPDGSVKVLDFGLAKAFTTSADADASNSPTLSRVGTQAGVIMGTAAYMSPEQTRGRDVDKRTDIWAFGCVLYEMLSGRKVFPGSNVTDILAAVIRAEPDWSLLPVNLHPRIRESLERCLEKEADNRWHDVADVRVDLKKAVATGPTVQQHGGIDKGFAGRSSLRHFVPGVVLGVMLTALGAGLIGYFEKPATKPEVVRFTHVLDDVGFARFGESQGIALSPDGSRLAYLDLDIRQVRLRSMDDFAAPPVRGTEGAAGTLFFSPDGQWIGFRHVDGLLKKVEVSGGTAVTLANMEEPATASWGPDHTIVFDGPEGILQISADGSQPTVMVPSRGDEQLRSPRLLPNGERITFTAIDPAGDPHIEVFSVVAKERRSLVADGRDAHYLPEGYLVYGSGSTLYAARFDAQRGELLGASVAVLEGVLSRFTQHGLDMVWASSDRSLVFVPARAEGFEFESTIVALDAGKLTTLIDSSAWLRWPHSSPDGRKLAVVEMTEATGESPELWVYDIASGNRSRLVEKTTPRVGPWPAAAIWTPDGEKVTYAQGTSIYARDIVGGAPEVVWEGEYPKSPWSWSPDGRHLLFVEENPDTGPDIWVFTLGKEAAVPLVSSPLREDYPRFSPDGEWFTYTTFADQEGWVWVSRFPPRGAPVQIAAGNWSDWSPDGKTLYIRTLAGKLMQLAIDLEDSVALGEPELTLDNPETIFVLSQVAPDGRILVTITNVRAEIRVITNWTRELLERVPVD